MIEPRAGGVRARAREIWQYRRLTIFFARKSMQKVYARTKLGWGWIFIRPLFPLFVKTIVFGGLLSVDTGPVPYFIFLLVGTIIWDMFAGAATWGTRALELNRGLLRQIYIPRLILPVSMMSRVLINFGVLSGVLIGAWIWYWTKDGVWYFALGPQLLLAPVALGLAMTFALAIALWTSVPALEARDVRFTLGYVMGFWEYLTPIMYPASAVPERWREWLVLNPMASIVELLKFSLLGMGTVNWAHFSIAVGIIFSVLISGLMFFSRAEATAADKV